MAEQAIALARTATGDKREIEIDVPRGYAVAAWWIRAAWPRRWAICWPMP